jgi:hypothetical protein
MFLSRTRELGKKQRNKHQEKERVMRQGGVKNNIIEKRREGTQRERQKRERRDTDK